MPELLKGARPIRDVSIKQHYESYIHADIARSEYIEGWRHWLVNSKHKSLSGLDQFKFADFVNGTSQTFDQFVLRNQGRRIVVLSGEFQYHRCITRAGNFAVVDVDDLQKHDAVIVSLPFSDTGNYHRDFESLLSCCNDLKLPVCLDLAYWGIGKNINLDLSRYPCIQELTSSLSKPFYKLETHRIGVRFSRTYLNDGISMLNEVGMANSYSMGLAQHFFKKFSADWNWDQHQTKYLSVCSSLGVDTTNTIIFALGNSRAHGEFFRGVPGQHRVCVSDFLSDES